MPGAKVMACARRKLSRGNPDEEAVGGQIKILLPQRVILWLVQQQRAVLQLGDAQRMTLCPAVPGLFNVGQASVSFCLGKGEALSAVERLVQTQAQRASRFALNQQTAVEQGCYRFQKGSLLSIGTIF